MNRRGAFASMASGLVTVAALATAPAVAEARDRVYWSVDVASPGVATSVSNYRAPYYPAYPAPPVVVYPPAPIVTYPAPVIYAPPPVVYRPRPVFVHPAPVIVAPRYYGRGWDGHRGHGHGRGHGKRWHD